MYPDSIDKFIEKLNKIDNNTYVIEEEVTLKDGVYQGYLDHDNVSATSINVYSGKKLTGEKIDNFILSTPSKTPWKKNIKIFSDYPVVYITYETQGDTVEAEDINIIQESIVNTQKEIDRYKGINDTEVNKLKEKTKEINDSQVKRTEMGAAGGVATLDSKGVNVQTPKAHTHDDRYYTKTNVENKINDAINNIQIGGRNLVAMNTLKGGNVYTTTDFTNYPKNGSITMSRVTGDSNGGLKYDQLLEYEPNTNYILKFKMKCTADTIKNIYFHNGQKFLNTKVYIDGTYIGSMATTQTTSVFDDGEFHEIVATYTTSETLVDSSTGSNQTFFQPNKGLNTNPYSILIEQLKLEKGDKATDWSPAPEDIDLAIDSKANANDVYKKSETYTKTEANNKFATKDEIADTGHGDMTKAVYDTNKNGIVDKAESVEWGGILNKPTRFTPSTHKHTKAQISDFPSSLPANGGNADTLDNKHASDFMKAGPLKWNDLKGV